MRRYERYCFSGWGGVCFEFLGFKEEKIKWGLDYLMGFYYF